MDEETKKKLLKLGVVVLVLLVVSSFFLAKSLSDDSDTGLFAGNQQEAPQPITAQDREDEYESREVFPEDVVTNLESSVLNLLSAGQFDELDEQLKDWGDSYKDVDDQSSDITGTIDAYRSDIAFYKNLSSRDAMDKWYFQTPNALAAAVAYAPVSVKYKAFIHRDSALLPASREDIMLHEAELSNSELKTILDGINAQRTEDGKFTALSVYDMVLFGYSCRLIAVTDNTTFLYQPYSLQVLNDNSFDITVSLADDIMASNPDADLDEMFAAPTQMDFATEQSEDSSAE